MRDSRLHDIAAFDAVEEQVVVESVLHQGDEMITVLRRLLVELYDKRALRRLKLYVRRIGRARARRHIDLWETNQIEQIVSDGMKQGIFSSNNAHLSALLIFYALKGVEQAYFRDRNARLIDGNRQEIVRVIFDGLKLK